MRDRKVDLLRPCDVEQWTEKQSQQDLRGQEARSMLGRVDKSLCSQLLVY